MASSTIVSFRRTSNNFTYRVGGQYSPGHAAGTIERIERSADGSLTVCNQYGGTTFIVYYYVDADSIEEE